MQRGQKILRDYAIAIGPARLGAQMKGIGAAVRARVPALGDARRGLGMLIERGQTLIKIAQNIVRFDHPGFLRIERIRLWAVAAQQRRARKPRAVLRIRGVTAGQKRHGGKPRREL